MSPKNKRSKKKKAINKKIAKEKPEAKILPFTAGRLPCVSRSMPQAASAVPLVSKEIPLISKTIPQFSAISNVTIPRQWGKMPSKKWGASKIRPTKRRELKRPEDIGLFKFLGKLVTAPYQPVEMIKALTALIHAQAEEEKDPKLALEQKLLELRMRREMGEISEEDHKIEETKLKRRLKNLEERRDIKEKAKEIKGKPKQKKKKRKRKRR